MGMDAKEFKALRAKSKLTQIDAGKLLGVTARTIARWESGVVEIPALKGAGIRELIAEYREENR